ncbi:MAG TPA: BamA/TamA family outer membrane protein, partial [Bryobacteraceae bacterium]|nr:BamA/TamA family outer membrane protein [Bryobacteraceae bacterium]
PERLPWLHRTILQFRENRIPQKITYGYKGIRPRFGKLGPVSGFGAGLAYFRPSIRDDRFTVRSSITASPLHFFMFDGEFEARRLAGNGFVNVLAFHRFSPAIDFYGVGSTSSLSNLTSYSLEENNVQLTGGWFFGRRVRAGGILRYFTANVGSTRRPDRPSAEQVFRGPEVPGLGGEAPYTEAGGFAELLADRSLGAAGGGTRASVRWTQLQSRGNTVPNFTRFEALAEHNVLFLNQQRAFVVRGRTVLNRPAAANAVPFYLQPQLGGPDDLRGFAGRRFYDNNLATATVEYQWQVLSGMWLAAFTDAGKVFPRWNQWSDRRLETSYGIGVRLGAPGIGSGRFDFAVSREGTQFWIVFATF